MKIVAVTSCPTGIAHTFMAAEALKKTAEVMGHEIKIEMQGSVGTKSVLSEADIFASDVVILATDIRVDASRFAGKPVYETRISESIRHTREVLEAAIKLVPESKMVSAEPAPEAGPILNTPESEPPAEGNHGSEPSMSASPRFNSSTTSGSPRGPPTSAISGSASCDCLSALNRARRTSRTSR